jgi:hypothetical protein
VWGSSPLLGLSAATLYRSPMAKGRRKSHTLKEAQPKYSAVLLEFAEPLLATAPPNMSARQMQSALSIAVTVWNAVLMDAEAEGGSFVAEVRKRMRELPAVQPLVEILIRRRERLFAEHRWFVGAYDVSPGLPGLGGFTVRVEARGEAMP